MKTPKHPMQPIVRDEEGTYRFKDNAVVRFMLDAGRRGEQFSLNTLDFGSFPQEDVDQFYQLIGYSVSGYGDLSFISRESVEKADAETEALERVHRAARTRGIIK